MNYINDKIEKDGFYTYYDGTYYSGKNKNGWRNGKIIIYYSNKKINCKLDFIKYIWKNGDYYFGQYKQV